MKIDIVSRKLIKPSVQTPDHLRVYKISMIDELNPSMHVVRIFFYESTIEGFLIKLEESLSKVLSHFYPLAGRYNMVNHLVDCNDYGSEFMVAEVDCQLHELIGDIDHLNHLLPVEIGAADEPTDPILAVQVNRFQCGGVAIGVCSSHRIFDSCSQAIFLKAWANVAVEGGLDICPDFDSPIHFPSQNISPIQFGLSRTRNTSIVTRRLVFDKNAITKLRDKLAHCWTNVRPPSRVVIVSSILSQAILRADMVKQGKWRASIIGQAINVRERTVPPISKYACGTWASMSFLESNQSETSCLANDLSKMISKMNEVTFQGIKDCARILSDKKFGRKVLIDSEYNASQKATDPNAKVIWISDWSKFEDYDFNLGFGKPVWVSLADVPVEDFFILMNTKNNDGMEAWLFMHESDIPYVEMDEELQMFTLI